LLARPAFGQAAGFTLELRNDAPGATCFGSAQLEARIAHYSARRSQTGGLRVVLELTGSDTARLRILRGGAVLARRVFERLPAACADRRDAVALSIALALDHASTATAADSGDAEPTAEPTPEAGPPPGAGAASPSSAAPTPPAAPLPAPASDDSPGAGGQSAPPRDNAPVIMGSLPTSTSRTRNARTDGEPIRLHLGAHFIAEALPFPVWSGAIGVELPLGPQLALSVSGVASLTGEAQLAGHGARGRLLGLLLLACRSMPLGALSLAGCAGAGFAAADVSGRDYPLPRPDTTLLWAAGLARIAARWPASGPLSLRVLVQAQVNVSRPELHVDGATESLRTAIIGATAGLELVAALP
jgi:hypothetical protein